jgi:hypothetical protein
MEGADIYQIAKNWRTSVEMIEKFYAAQIKTILDASAINTMKGTIARERKRLHAADLWAFSISLGFMKAWRL